jgi:hypothetical protein
MKLKLSRGGQLDQPLLFGAEVMVILLAHWG